MKQGTKVIVKEPPKSIHSSYFEPEYDGKRVFTVKRVKGLFAQLKELEHHTYWNGWLLKDRLEEVSSE